MPYIVASSPHWTDRITVGRVMAEVILALLPALVWGGLVYGYRALLVVAVCVVTAMAVEALCLRLMHRPITLNDGSAVVTGALLAAVLPANVPLWFAALGAAFAIAVAKQAFGGLGANIWNPALLARAAMQVSGPEHLIAKRWPWFSLADGWMDNPGRSFAGSFAELNQKAAALPDAVSRATMPMETNPSVAASAADLFTGATPLTAVHYPPLAANVDAASAGAFALPEVLTPSWIDVGRTWLGAEGGCIGEVAAGLLLLGGIYMLARRIVTWEIPLAYLATAALCVFVLPMPVVAATEAGETVFYRFAGSLPLMLLHIGGGGLMLGAFFMATDYVTSPLTRPGKLIFGAGCGLLTMLIRFYGGYPEGVCYAILLMNTAVPLIDGFTRPRVFGTTKPPAAPSC